MEIRVLRYFLAIAREGNITNAANILHVTQPTLSRQLRDLEESLGQKLFIRKSHRVVLTAEGVFLRKKAEEIVALVDKTEAAFTSMEESVIGNVYIGGGETAAMKLLAEAVKELHQEYPQIQYHLYSGNAEDVTDRLDKGLLDFGVLIEPVDVSKYDYAAVPAKDRWGVVMRKDSPLAGKTAIVREDLLTVPLLVSRQVIQQTGEENEFIKWFSHKFDTLNIVATYNLVYNAAVMVEAGLGYAVTLDHLVGEGEHSELCFRPLAPALESGLLVVWKKNQLFPPSAELFLKKMKEAFAQYD